MKRKKSIPTLTKAEEEVMQIIWELERCLVRDIIDKIGDPEMPHSTISFVDHKAYGKTYEYFPMISKEDYAQHGVVSLLEKYFGGSPKKLVSFLVKNEDMNLKELNQVILMMNYSKP